ncbi:O-acetyl-ADP-ribose deacetylase [Ancylobacter sp.]|uniref:O-acetyl-ADP-ribose deacetylase n=1 Tax=Ancylobacter sp. TaxID=1872567 RepID=UPI003BACA102
MTTLRAIKANITTLAVDAIVNAANSSLLGGGGVDGAIHRAAGPEMLHECRLLGGCRTGEVKMTRGYNLPARFVLHTVGPVWRGGGHGEDALLAQCYGGSIELARTHGLGSIAFPGISTGRYGNPIARAADIAVATAAGFRGQPGVPGDIIFCCFPDADLLVYENLLAALET